MDYQFRDIENKWQQFWAENKTYQVDNNSEKPKYYVLDMFPYPSGAGLHVGHPLGYIASDIFARYKRLKGFNVLHPMGYDSFGLPAEQYAIQTGQHPAITTEANIKRYREQLDNIGFSFDWSREVRTSDPEYYKWTQWIFMQLFNSWYNLESNKAESIEILISQFEANGSVGVNAVSDEDTLTFSAKEWKQLSDADKQKELLKYRLTYLKESTVNWCAALGTVLANDEVKDGVSERGGYPVEQKKMMQWSMRITAYADRLLEGLDTIDWPEPLKEMQRNWIGKSVGASVHFPLEADQEQTIEVFTTRVDTIFGVSFLVIAPEHELVESLTTADQKAEIEAYIAQTKKKSELDRMADAKTVSGAFTGSYALNPLDGTKIPVWIADYVLAGYGTGAVMAVPSGDQRDYLFAKHFNLPIIQILDAQQNLATEADPTKEGKYVNSDFINGLTYQEAIPALTLKLEELNAGKAKVQYRMRDAIFGRQRYWGEPVPVYFEGDLPHLIKEEELPLVLPEIDKYLPTETGEPPLGRAENWKYQNQYEYELSTMPGWAGSSWYWYRYMASPEERNQEVFAPESAINYWKDVDLYIGGSEHATGHLLYSRFWNKFLKDLGYVVEEEPFKKLINQGMIQGVSLFVKVISYQNNSHPDDIIRIYASYDDIGDETILIEGTEYKRHSANRETVIPISEADDKLNKIYEEGFKNLIYPRGNFLTGKEGVSVNIETDVKWRIDDSGRRYLDLRPEVMKMSKSKFNVVNPDDIIERYGADTLRLYEMFLGPLEQSKPWNTNGIEGVFKFLRKFWKLFHNDKFEFVVSDEEPSKAEYKSLHKIIKKVEDDIERFSFNTSVSSFMICVNELNELKCNKRKILQEFVIVLAPYAPHITEELWSLLGNVAGSLSYAPFPKFNPEYLIEDEFAYPISFNGKMKMNLNISLSLEAADIEKFVLADADVQRYLDGKSPKKMIVVKGRIVNIVL